MRTLSLASGQSAIVDDDDYDRLSRYSWQLREGYASRSVHGQRPQTVLLHNEILGRRPGMRADHIDGDRLNCQRSNLRHATLSQNSANRKAQRNNQTGYKGVGALGHRYRARITVNGEKMFLGYFTTAEDAARAYDRAARTHFGEFARTNFEEETDA